MVYWETRNKDMCFNACDNQFKQRDVHPLFWMKVSEYSDNGITNNIQEICMARFPRFITPKEQIIWSTPTYLSKHIYNTHKIINTNMNVRTLKCKNNLYIGEI